jgi:hypothetical protein
MYLSCWYWRLKQRTDGKRAIIALARKLLVIIYTLLKTDQQYDDEKFQMRKVMAQQKHINRMVNELTHIGYIVSAAV